MIRIGGSDGNRTRIRKNFLPYVETLRSRKLVDPTRIELATDALQVLLAPEVHASPY